MHHRQLGSHDGEQQIGAHGLLQISRVRKIEMQILDQIELRIAHKGDKRTGTVDEKNAVEHQICVTPWQQAYHNEV